MNSPTDNTSLPSATLPLTIPDTPATTPPVVLVFAASDPSSGAGIQADILALASMGCHPLTVITALTVQDTLGVESVHPVDAELVEAQARIILEDIPVAAFKVGMLGSVENIVAIAEIVADYPQIPLILDPVLASGRGDSLSNHAMLNAMRELLLPQTTVLTPNTHEARQLCDFDDADEAFIDEEVGDVEELEETHEPLSVILGEAEEEKLPGEDPSPVGEDFDNPPDGHDEPLVGHPILMNPQNPIQPDDEYGQLATQLMAMGAMHVLITGTHAQTTDVCNRLYGEDGLIQAEHWPRLPGSYHGSGCTLASALAAALACGASLKEASHEAQEYTWQTLANAFRPGMGQFIPDRLFWARGNSGVPTEDSAEDDSN